VKAALLAPAGIVMDAGTVAAALLLDKVRTCPPVAAVAFNVTVQEEVAPARRELLAQARVLSNGTPAPVRLMAVEGLAGELLEIVIVPAAAPAMDGLKRTVSDADWPGFRVMGKVTPEIAKPLPDTVAELMVRGPVPVEDSVNDWVAAALTPVLPNARLFALRPSAAVVVGLTVIGRVVDTPPDVAVKLTVCTVWTA
jgi:hypothetical protein